MSTTDAGPGGVSETLDATRPHPTRRPLSRRQRVSWMVCCVGLAVLFAVAAGFGLRWWTHPSVLGGTGVSMRLPTGPVAGSRFTFELAVPPVDRPDHAFTITFRSTPTAQLRTNTAAAVVTFDICHHTDPHDFFLSVMGGGSHDCASLTPIRAGTTMPWPVTSQYIVATVIPRRPGRVELTGVDFDYATGRGYWWRRGTDHVDLDVRQTVR